MNIYKGISIALMLLLCIPQFGCGKSDDALEVRIAYFPNITHAQALIMKNEGMLEEKLDDKFDVKWISFNAGPSEIEALFAGEIDIGYIGPVPAVNGYVQSGGDLRIIAGASNGGSVLVAGDGANIVSVSDLDGKTVAVPQFGNTQHLSLLSLLRDNDLSPKSNGGTVNVVQSSNADIINLMDQGSIEAALVPEPWGSILELKNGAELVLDYDQVDTKGIPSTAIVIVSCDFLNAHSDIVEKFIASHKEATDFVLNNVADAHEIVNDQIYAVTQNRIEPDVLEKAFSRLDITYKIPSDSIMRFAEAGARENLSSGLPENNIIDDSFIR